MCLQHNLLPTYPEEILPNFSPFFNSLLPPIFSPSLPPSLSLLQPHTYFAKCKSYPNHFLAITSSTLSGNP